MTGQWDDQLPGTASQVKGDVADREPQTVNQHIDDRVGVSTSVPGVVTGRFAAEGTTHQSMIPLGASWRVPPGVSYVDTDLIVSLLDGPFAPATGANIPLFSNG